MSARRDAAATHQKEAAAAFAHAEQEFKTHRESVKI